jgi:hypothetical protein
MPHPIRAPFSIPAGAQFNAIRAGGARRHQGTDYHCPIGTPIYATGDGKVVSNVRETGVGIGFGNYVIIGYPGGRQTLDGHMSERSGLAVGTAVTADTIVGYVGLTGNAIHADPPGSHDHHQVWLGGKLVDPQAYYGTSTAGESGNPVKPSNPTKPEEDYSMASGIYTRIGSGEGAGGIFYQDAPLSPLYPIDGTQWAAAAANKNGYANVDAQELQALMRKVGNVKLDANGRVITDSVTGRPVVVFP